MCEKCRTEDSNRIPRPVRLADFLVIGVGFIHHIATAVEIATDSLLEVARYHALRKEDVANAWEEFAQELEEIREDLDG